MPQGALAGWCPACLLAQGTETEPGGPAPSRFEPPSAETVARLFPQLEILGLIGAGGMGAVYRARQRSLDRLVALKLLPSHPGGGVAFAERFTREARALARLNHPNIVAVYEFGQVEGLPFFIMEFVDGANLRQLERAGRLAPREALQIIPQICDALQYAHDEGVVHRDIKPENILVDRKGRVRIADFGLAKIVEGEAQAARLTHEGQVMGTPHYMAPEQLERPLAVDHRADIYSLGVVFYEMLTGDLPLGRFAPPSARATGVAVDVRLDEVVLRALENDPERRYQRVSEVKSQVETIAETPAGPRAVAGAADPVGAAGEPCFLRWAGFPVVRERGAVRRVSWHATFLAFTAALAAVTVGFALIAAAAGQTLLGWLGVIGWPSLVVRVLLAGGWVAWGVRQTLRSKLPGSPLPRRTRSRLVHVHPQGRLLAGMVASVAVIAVLLHGLMQDPWLEPRFRTWLDRRSQPQVVVDQRAKPAPSGDHWVAELPGRGAVSLLAVGGNAPALNAWWSPDGQPITNATYEVRDGGSVLGDGQRVMTAVVRVADLPEGAGWAGVRSVDGRPSASGGVVVQANRRLHQASVLRLAIPPQARVASFRVGLGLEPWRTVGTEDPVQRRSTRQPKPGDPSWMVQIHDFGERGTNLHVTLVMSYGGHGMGRAWEDPNWQHRVVAVDTNGVEHAYAMSENSLVDRSMLSFYTFRGLTLAQFQELRLQLRPVHWIEFAQVAAEPRVPLPSPLYPQFSEAIELELTGGLDLDSGRVAARDEARERFALVLNELQRLEAERALALARYAAEHPNVRRLDSQLEVLRRQSQLPDSAPRTPQDAMDDLRWLDAERMELLARPGDLLAWSLMVVGLSAEEFDTIRPAAVIARLNQGGYGPRSLKPQSPGAFPMTFGFRTQDEGIGVLQVLSLEGPQGGVTLRYRSLVQGPSPAP